MALNQRKVAMVGCGSAGAASCFALMQSGLFTEMVLIDAYPEKAEGEAMDIAQGLTFTKPMKIYAGTYEDLADAAVVIVTAAGTQRRDDTRLDLVKKNVAIFKNIIPEIAKRNEEGIMLIVANPVGTGSWESELCSTQPASDICSVKSSMLTPATYMRIWSASRATEKLRSGAAQAFPVFRSVSSARCADIPIPQIILKP